MGPLARPAGRHARAPWQAEDLAVVWLMLALPPLRLLARSAPDRSTSCCSPSGPPCSAASRARTRSAAPRSGCRRWRIPRSPSRYTLSVLRPERRWRGRSYARLRRPPRSRSSPNSAPIIVISTPVAITCVDRVDGELQRGEGEDARPGAPLERRRDADGRAQDEREQPRRAARARCPRRRSTSPTCRRGSARTRGTRGRPSPRRRRSTRPTSPRARARSPPRAPPSPRRRRTRARRAATRAARARSRRPDCRRPCVWRSTPWRRATSSATGTEPRR